MQLFAGNLMTKLPKCPADEVFEALLEAKGLRLERILSAGQATPAGDWLVQYWDEWVVLLTGGASALSQFNCRVNRL